MLTKLFTFLNYFLSPLPGPEFSYYLPVLILAILGVALSIAMRIHLKKNTQDKILRKLFKNSSHEILVISGLTLTYLLCRWQNIYLFSMRLFIYVLAIWAIYKAYQLIKLYKITYPELKAERQKQLVANKYLPKAKRKKK